MTPQAITQEHDAPVFFVYDRYQHRSERDTDRHSLARGYRISAAEITEVLDWLNSTEPAEEPGFTATTRELHVLAPRQDRPGEYLAIALLTKRL
jgi:hypothetical protein